ncbi:acyl-CoA-binding domain-containing protein 6 isoform X3 [Mastomys coucha]|uniref:acyl-CoA-binding domain-containing protein 6 isoform X3 n=1 Tax=Mastomys coucha TaxID=35658 RepID=UPI001261F790|nr:acyl-CoA-binding domain-containing protein 6 isoform X3 [Mastomys coucha]
MSKAWFRWPAGSSFCTCMPGTSRSKLAIAIFLNQTSLILKESKNDGEISVNIKEQENYAMEAWKALSDSSPSQAMQEYIAAVRKLDPGWNPQVSEKKGKESSSGFGGPVVSSLYHEETIREEDKNIFDYCRENNIDHITKAIKSKTVDVNMTDEEGRALLHWACDRGHKELVKVLLQYEAGINCQTEIMAPRHACSDGTSRPELSLLPAVDRPECSSLPPCSFSMTRGPHANVFCLVAFKVLVTCGIGVSNI